MLKKIDAMHAEYGVLSRVSCRTCPHLVAHCNGDCTRVWYKCRMYGTSSGPGTDWRCGNEACGAFTIAPEEARSKHLYGEVYRRVNGLRDTRTEQLPGQISIDDLA